MEKSLAILQAEIDQTEYWDVNIIDFYSNFLGDEVTILLYNDSDTSWKISFLVCAKVAWETDAAWRSIKYVRNMTKPQLGYYGQDITVVESRKLKGFYDVSIDLTILTAKIVYKEIFVNKVSNEEAHRY